MTKNKKDKKKGPKPQKVHPEASQPRPKPVSWNTTAISSLPEAANTLPLAGCWIDAGWEEHGLARVVIARQQEDGRLVAGIYLVDPKCLGVKNCDTKGDLSRSGLEKRLPVMVGNPRECDPGYAHELIWGSINYARRFGFEPHPDFAQASKLLDPPEAHPRKHDITFGENGKPLFVAGPYDNVRQILATLERTAGPGNYAYISPLV